MIKEFYTYILFDPEKQEPFYVGKGKRNRYNEQHNSFCENVISRIKRNGFELIIKKTKFMTEQEAFDQEIALIAEFGRRDLQTGTLTNLTDGGEGTAGYIFTEEHKQKLRKPKKDTANMRKPKTEEHKRKQSESMKGKIPWNKGKKHTEEHKRKMKDNHRSKNGYVPWNKGLTKETDIRVKQYGITQSINCKTIKQGLYQQDKMSEKSNEEK